VDAAARARELQRAMVGSVGGVDEVARRVVRAIDRGDLYILTHAEQRDILRRRAARLDRMFEADRSRAAMRTPSAPTPCAGARPGSIACSKPIAGEQPWRRAASRMARRPKRWRGPLRA